MPFAAAAAVTVADSKKGKSGQINKVDASLGYPVASATDISEGDDRVSRRQRRRSSVMSDVQRPKTVDEHGNVKNELARELLIERLELEQELYSGLRMILLCTALFASLISTLHFQKDKEAQFALQQSYEDTFSLEDTSDILTPHQLREHLREFSAQVRTLQVLSSDFFVETEGQLKILGGIKRFTKPQVLEVAEIMPRIDSESFTFMAWVQRDSPDTNGYILRKPLGRGPENYLSCYAWHIGSAPSIEFGAHDVGLPDQSVAEERVVADGEWELDESFHLEMMVVNRSSIMFYRDATLRSVLPLRRPVTDCSGTTFLVGDEGLQLAEITFYARTLSDSEIEEIFFAGFTFEAIAAGKLPYHPEETNFDRLLGAQDEAVSTLLTSNKEGLEQAALGRVLTQALIQELQEDTSAALRTVSLAPDAGCTREWPPCQYLRGVNLTAAADAVTGKDYYNLIPEAARGGAGPQEKLSVPLVPRQQMLQYEASSFPSWEGQSASFSLWLRPDMQGYIIAKSPDAVQNTMCWSIFVSETWGIGSLADAPLPDGSWRYPTNVIRWGGGLEAGAGQRPPITDDTKKLRHIAIVFDKESNSLRAYVDGTLVADQPFAEADVVGRLDCAATESTYIGFMHRSPGGLAVSGEIQDFRLYVGSALSGEEVAALATGAGSEAVRECSLPNEGQDSNYKDMNGNNCAWYQEAMGETTAVCTASAVRAECPVACGTQEPCFAPPAQPVPSFQIWEKVMRIQPRLEGVGSLCVREGLDVVATCAAAMARRDPLSYPPDGTAWTDKYTSLVEGGLGEPNVTDCRLLAALVEPSCAFKVEGDWTASLDAAAAAAGEWTVSFWYKSGKPAEQLNSGVDMWMTFYSSIAPPIPAIRILSYYGILLFQIWGRPDCDQWTEDVNMPVSFVPGQWVHIALTFGAPRGPERQRTLQVVKDSVFEFDLLNRAWCAATQGEFIQAFTVISAHEALLSPISVSAQAKPVKQLQLDYYQLRPAMRLRRGPQLPEQTRHSRPVAYQRAQFDAAGALLAPPILLQRRLRSTEQCAFQSGSDFKDKVWRDAVEGMTCGPPYVCSEALLASPSALLTCRGSESADRFLGRRPLTVGGESVFAEFLPSIADASILVRDGQLFETSTFIDTQTDELSISVVLFAPNVGVLTLITIEAILTSRVNVGYTVEQFQAVEGEELDRAIRQAVLTLAFVGLSVLELLQEAVTSWREGQARHLRLVMLDVVILVGLPVLFLAMRIRQLRRSSDILSKSIGQDGLGGVPWGSTEMSVDAKMDAFFAGLEELQHHFADEQRMSVLAFASAITLLLRVILATKAHPRVAVLVSTIEKAADDLWHFILLFLVLFMGFGGLAYVSFGNQKYEFHSLGITFETLFDMMLGSLPKSGGGAKRSWTNDPLLVIFVTLFNFLVFFVMLNFIIAIIVESYLSTKRRLEDELTEQEFIHDIVDSMRAICKRVMYGWPRHRRLIKALDEATADNVDEERLAVLFPEWERPSLQRFVKHYAGFDFLRPEVVSTLVKMEGELLVSEVEHRVHSLLQGQPPQPHHALRSHLHHSQNLNASTHGGSRAGNGSPAQDSPLKLLPKPPLMEKADDTSLPSGEGADSSQPNGEGSGSGSGTGGWGGRTQDVLGQAESVLPHASDPHRELPPLQQELQLPLAYSHREMGEA